MKMFLVVAVLAGLGFAGYKVLTSGGAPRAGLTRIIELPGMAVSTLSLSGGNPGSLVMMIGAVLLVLILLYAVMSK